MNNSTVLVLGASDNIGRMSYSAVRYLLHRGLRVQALGQRKAYIDHLIVHNEPQHIKDTDVVTIFLAAAKQRKYYDYILSLNPKKLVFNPGSENPELEYLAQKNNIQVVKGCTIALLANGLW